MADNGYISGIQALFSCMKYYQLISSQLCLANLLFVAFYKEYI